MFLSYFCSIKFFYCFFLKYTLTQNIVFDIRFSTKIVFFNFFSFSNLQFLKFSNIFFNLVFKISFHCDLLN